MQKSSPRLLLETISCDLEGTKLCFVEVYFKCVLVYKGKKNTHHIIREHEIGGSSDPRFNGVTLTMVPFFSEQPKETTLSSYVCCLVKHCQRHCSPWRVAFPFLYLSFQYYLYYLVLLARKQGMLRNSESANQDL